MAKRTKGNDFSGLIFIGSILLAIMAISIAFTPVAHDYDGVWIWQADGTSRFQIELFNGDEITISGNASQIAFNGSFLKPESPIQIEKDGETIPPFCERTSDYFDTKCHVEELEVGTTYVATLPPGTYLNVEILGDPDVYITININRTVWYWLNSPAMFFSMFF